MTSVIKNNQLQQESFPSPALQKLQSWKKSLKALFNGADATMNEYLKVSQKFWYRH